MECDLTVLGVNIAFFGTNMICSSFEILAVVRRPTPRPGIIAGLIEVNWTPRAWDHWVKRECVSSSGCWQGGVSCVVEIRIRFLAGGIVVNTFNWLPGKVISEEDVTEVPGVRDTSDVTLLRVILGRDADDDHNTFCIFRFPHPHPQRQQPPPPPPPSSSNAHRLRDGVDSASN